MLWSECRSPLTCTVPGGVCSGSFILPLGRPRRVPQCENRPWQRHPGALGTEGDLRGRRLSAQPAPQGKADMLQTPLSLSLLPSNSPCSSITTQPQGLFKGPASVSSSCCLLWSSQGSTPTSGPHHTETTAANLSNTNRTDVFNRHKPGTRSASFSALGLGDMKCSKLYPV